MAMADLRIYVHPEGAEPTRADKALASFLSGEFSRSRLEESFKAGKVKAGGRAIAKRRMLLPGETVEIEVPELPPSEVAPADLPLEIVYEDDDIAVVNKPAGMTVHPGNGTGGDTLCHAMMFHCGGKLSMAGGKMRPGIVHRLDRETSGVLFMAKTDAAYYELVKMFSERRLVKEYLAVVSGVPTVRSGSVRKPIGRHPTFRTKMCVCDPEKGRDAATDWTLVEKYGSFASLISCRIHTGRTHQIRVHMSDLGYPILGDYTYGFQKNKLKGIASPERVMLHAYRLSFEHPIRAGVQIDAVAKPPKDFSGLLEVLKKAYC